MLSGETDSPPRVIGAAQPKPTTENRSLPHTRRAGVTIDSSRFVAWASALKRSLRVREPSARTIAASTLVAPMSRARHGGVLRAPPESVIRFYGDDATTSRGANWCEDHSSRGRRRPGQNE